MSAETVDQMIGQILEHEGPEYTNRPGDRGGPTKFGITLGLLQSLRYDVNRDGKIDAEDVEALTGDEASQLYRRVFYLQPKINTLPADLQPMVFDEAVNFGAAAAIKCVQKAVLCQPDGVIGDGTRSVLIDAIKRLGLTAINNRIVDQFLIRYSEIAAGDPTQEQFLNGWKNRANSWRMK